MDVDRAGIAEIVESPHLVEQLIAREDVIAVRSEEVEELQLLRRDVEVPERM